MRADRMSDFLESMLRLYMARKEPAQDLTGSLNSLDDEALQAFAREAMPAGALVEAGSSEGAVTHAVRPEGDMALPGGGYKEADFKSDAANLLSVSFFERKDATNPFKD